MGIELLTRVAGYGFFTGHMEGNNRAWEVLKRHCPRETLAGVSLFRRHKPSIALMRKDLWKFDRIGARREGLDPVLYDLARACVKRWFSPPSKLRPMRVESVPPTTFPSGTSAGYPYVQMGIRSKGEAFPMALSKAVAIEGRLLSGEPVTFGPTMVYPRAVVSEVSKPKCRTIFCAPLDLCILQASFAIAEWKHQKSGVTPAAYDYTPFGGGYARLRQDMVAPGHQYLNTDFSKYDGTIPAFLVADVSDDWFESYDSVYDDGTPLPPNYKRLFTRAVKQTVFTRILMPDGYLYEKDVGTASGDYIFQLVQNRITCLMMVYTLLKLGVPLHLIRRIKTLGDDCLASYCYPPFSLEAIARVFLESFGVILNIDKSNQTSRSDQITFLGRSLSGGQSSRSTVDIVLATLYPEENAQDDILLCMRIVSLFYENAGANSKAEWFLRTVWSDIPLELRKHLETRTDLEWPKRWAYLFKNLGFSHPPKCRLPSDFDLIHLVFGLRGGFVPNYESLNLVFNQ